MASFLYQSLLCRHCSLQDSSLGPEIACENDVAKSFSDSSP